MPLSYGETATNFQMLHFHVLYKATLLSQKYNKQKTKIKGGEVLCQNREWEDSKTTNSK